LAWPAVVLRRILLTDFWVWFPYGKNKVGKGEGVKKVSSSFCRAFCLSRLFFLGFRGFCSSSSLVSAFGRSPGNKKGGGKKKKKIFNWGPGTKI